MKAITQLIKELARNRLFAFLNVFSVAITIAVVMIFAMKLQNDLGSKEPEVNMDKTLYMWRMRHFGPGGRQMQGLLSLDFYNKHLKDLKTPALVTAVSSMPWNFLRGTETKLHLMNQVDHLYFELFDFNFLEGKGITEQQFQYQEKVIVITRDVRDRFYKDGKGLGKDFEYEGITYRVVGVVDDVPSSCQDANGDFWIPREISSEGHNPYAGNYKVLAMAKTVGEKQAVKDEINQVIKRLNASFTNAEERIVLSGPVDHFDRMAVRYDNPEDYEGSTLKWLEILGQFLMLLAVPVISVISLNITYIRERGEEIAVRKAFGANQTVLIRKILFENVLLTFIGGVLGLVFSIVLAYTMPDFVFEDRFNFIGETYQLVLNAQVFLIALGVILIFGLISGIAPAVRISKLQPAIVLKGGEL